MYVWCFVHRLDSTQVTVGPKGAGKAVGFRPSGGPTIHSASGLEQNGIPVDNGTVYADIQQAMITAKAQLTEATEVLDMLQRQARVTATKALRANLNTSSIGRRDNWRGREYQKAREREARAQALVSYDLELVALQHSRVAEAHQALRQAIQAEITYHCEA